MKDTDYLSISARIRAMEGRLLNRERRERMIDARSSDEALKVLTECGYPEPESAAIPAVDAVLTQARVDLFADLKKSVPEPALVEVFQIKYDYHNAKAMLKASAMGENAAHLFMSGGRYPPKDLSTLLEKGEVTEVFQGAFQSASKALLEEHDPQQADTILDRACYDEMAEAAKKSQSKFLQGYVRLNVDAVNLRTAVRCARLGEDVEKNLLSGGDVNGVATVKGEELVRKFRNSPLAHAAEVGALVTSPGSGSLTEFERLCDNALTGYLSAAKRIPFGEQPVVGYLCAREAEATTVRTILALRNAGLSGDAIRERLRDSYV